MIKKSLTVAAVAAVLLAAPPLYAAEAGGSFKQLDADANGYVSPREAEAQPSLIVRWKELDTDKNNLLDTSEFSAFEAGESTIRNEDALPGGSMPVE